MKSTAKTVGLVIIIMLFSRGLSLISNQYSITFFGLTRDMNIYTFATMLPNIIFTSLGTALSTIVIPIFAGYISTNKKEDAFRFANNVVSLSMVFTLALSILGVLLSPLIVDLFNFKPEQFDFAVLALRIMFPVILFYALNYILQGILQSLGKFNMPALVSLPTSLILILYVFFFGSKYGVLGLLIAAFIGFAMQALILIPPVLKTEYRYRPSFDYKDPDIRKALHLIPPVLIGTSAYQINMLFNVTMATKLDATALINSVQNIMLYAILAFIYSVTAVVYPKLTALAAKQNMDAYKNALASVLKSILYFLIPASVGFFSIRNELVDLLFSWKEVTTENVADAKIILPLYAIGIVGVGIKEVADRAFYSLKDTRKPAINGLIIMLVNITFSLILIQYLGVFGIPLAYSISFLTGALVILYMLRKKIGSFGGKKVLITLAKVSVSSAVMALAVLPLASLISRYSFGFTLLDRIIKLSLPSAVGALVYFICTYILKTDEAVNVLNQLRTRMKFLRRS